MSVFFESVRSGGVIGMSLLGVLLVGFGALFLAVFDDRFNGENATKLKETVRAQSFEIYELEDLISAGEANLLNQKRNEVIVEKIGKVTKTLNLLTEKETELTAQIESNKKSLIEISDAQLTYRDEYRKYERERAVGETFDELTLVSGKKIKNAKIREILTDKVRFSTEFGSSSVTWDKLPDSWRERFQVGEGELKVYREKVADLRAQRNLVNAAADAKHEVYLREIDMKRSLDSMKKDLQKKTQTRDKGKNKSAQEKAKGISYQEKANSTSLSGNRKSYLKTAREAVAEASKIDARVRIIEGQIRDLEKSISKLEYDIEKMKK